ncbi:hypothetical protein C8R45DRAFT_297560 [Mycena sanguinolenta]|nr:hypothetical protein C8R45DRAFT_297560 [Mycena sanguinolenta]
MPPRILPLHKRRLVCFRTRITTLSNPVAVCVCVCAHLLFALCANSPRCCPTHATLPAHHTTTPPHLHIPAPTDKRCPTHSHPSASTTSASPSRSRPRPRPRPSPIPSRAACPPPCAPHRTNAHPHQQLHPCRWTRRAPCRATGSGRTASSHERCDG